MKALKEYPFRALESTFFPFLTGSSNGHVDFLLCSSPKPNTPLYRLEV